MARAPRPKITVTGAKEIEAALRALGPKLGRKVIRQAIRAQLKPIQAEVQSKIPDKALAKQVKVRTWPKRKAGVIALEVRVGDQDLKGEEWQRILTREYGSPTRPAHPAFRPAFDQMGKPALEAAMKQIRDGVEREAKA